MAKTWRYVSVCVCVFAVLVHQTPFRHHMAINQCAKLNSAATVLPQRPK